MIGLMHLCSFERRLLCTHTNFTVVNLIYTEV